MIVDLNSMILENEIRITQDVDWLTNMWKTAHDAGLLEVSFWASIGDPSITYNVSDMMILGSKLYVTITDGSLLIYSIDGGGWERVVLGYTPNCMASIGADIYIGCFHRVLRYATGTGILTDIGSVVASDPLTENVYTIAAIGSKIYCGGVFDSIDGVAMTGVAEYDAIGDAWSDIGGGGTNALGMISDGSNLYAGIGTKIRKWNGSSWNDLGTSPVTVSTVLCFAVYGTDLLMGCSSGDHLYIWDGSAWASFGGGVSGSVRDIGVYLTDVYVVGNLTTEGNYVARYSGGSWWSLDTGLNA